MKNTFSLTKRLEYSQVDWNYNYRIDCIFNDFQTITTFHSQEMGVDGPSMLKNSNAFWVLSKLKLQINELPLMGDEITANTFPTTVSSIKFMRDYLITKSGKSLILGTSEWCTLDATTGRLRKSSSVCYPFDMEHVEYGSGCTEFSKQKTTVEQKDYIYAHTVGYTDIDTNKHANNVSYVRMVLNAFSPEELCSSDVSEFEIYYLAQVYYGQQVQVYKVKTDYGYYIEGQNAEKPVFACVIKLKVK